MAGKMMIRGILFDFDGVLRNTEPIHKAVYTQMALELSQGKDEGRDVAGKSNVQLYQELLDQYGGNFTAKELSHRHFCEVFSQLQRQHIGPAEGLELLMQGLTQRGIPYGVVSSSERWFVEENLRQLQMLEGAVCVVTGDDGLPLKPSPAPYLAAAKAFPFPQEALLAVEDSYSGVTSAKAAGLHCAAFINPDSGVQDLAAADWRLNWLPELLTILDAMTKH
jgi:HAD superfamily hydrolase (TIGR01509 family)